MIKPSDIIKEEISEKDILKLEDIIDNQIIRWKWHEDRKTVYIKEHFDLSIIEFVISKYRKDGWDIEEYFSMWHNIDAEHIFIFRIKPNKSLIMPKRTYPEPINFSEDSSEKPKRKKYFGFF